MNRRDAPRPPSRREPFVNQSHAVLEQVAVSHARRCCDASYDGNTKPAVSDFATLAAHAARAARAAPRASNNPQIFAPVFLLPPPPPPRKRGNATPERAPRLRGSARSAASRWRLLARYRRHRAGMPNHRLVGKQGQQAHGVTTSL